MTIQSLVSLSMLMALTGLTCMLVATGTLTFHTQHPTAWAIGSVLWLTGACAIAASIACNLHRLPNSKGTGRARRRG